MSSRVQVSGHVLLAGIFLAVGLVGGCGGADERPTALPSESVAEATPSEAETPTPEPSVTQSPESEYGSVDPMTSIGQTVRYSGFADEVCSNEFYSSDAPGVRDGIALLDGGRLFLTCKGGHVLMDVFSGDVLWSRPADVDGQSLDEEVNSSVESVSPGPDHVYVITTTNHPAVELEAAYLSHEVEAFDAETGDFAWSAPLEEFVPALERSGNGFSVVETAGSTGYDIVLITGDSHSAFSASTGEPLWNTEEIIGDYVGLGISLEGPESWNSAQWSAYDVGTGDEIWTRAVPNVDGEDVFLEDNTVWQIGDSGVIALDLPTGRQVLNRLYPETWEDNGHVVTPSYSLAYDGTDLAMFQTDDLRKPLWSTASGPVTPIAVTRDLAMVQAESGLVAIDGQTGQIRTDVYLPEDATSSEWTVIDGLTLLDDGSIFELSPPAGLAAEPSTAEPEPSSDSPTPALT